MALMSDHFDQAREQVTHAISHALAEAEATEDNDEAYRRASWLADRLAEASIETGQLRGRIARRLRDAEDLSLAELARRFGVSRARVADMLRVREGAPGRAEPQPVVAVIVTSRLGVLVERRHDGKPPWTFPAGEIEPGESASDAAVREVKEETALDVIIGRELGRRIHPRTGRTMIYRIARPAPVSDINAIRVGDEGELAEVRWVPPADLETLMPDVYEPVRVYLEREPRRQSARPS
jgi:8-oxo-dGTP diphosphatase